jgi:hypothetical protein
MSETNWADGKVSRPVMEFSLGLRFSVPVAIRPVQSGGGRMRTSLFAFWLVAPSWLGYQLG